MGVEIVGIPSGGGLLRVRARSDPELHSVLADGDLVAIGKRPLPGHPPAVDEGAVAAAEILDEDPLPVPDERGMMPAHRRIGDDDVAGRMAAEDRPIGEDRNLLPLPGTSAELETARRHVSPRWDPPGSTRTPPHIPETFRRLHRMAPKEPNCQHTDSPVRWRPSRRDRLVFLSPWDIPADVPSPPIFPGSGLGKPFLGNGVTVARLALNQLV